MKCSPSYHGEARIDVGSKPCDDTCFHWQGCLKELNRKPDFKNKIWIEEDAIDEDIQAGTYHKRTFNNGYPKKHSKYSQWVVFKKWHLQANI
jgi:hypothetical protein